MFDYENCKHTANINGRNQHKIVKKLLGLGHWEDPEESGGEGGGRGDWDGEYL